MEKKVEHLLLSSNAATGLSLNLSPQMTCAGMPCAAYCYARRRTAKQAARLCEKLGLREGLITSNSGPITWKRQQQAYKQNTRLLVRLPLQGIEREAEYIASRLRRSRISPGNLRFFGCGDATWQAMYLAFSLGRHGVQAWGFTRKEIFTSDLARWCDHAHGVRGFVRPHFLLSVDRFCSPADVELRIDAGIALNQVPKVLAYMAFAGETGASIRRLKFWKHIRVVLGYHSTQTHTVIGGLAGKECPKTAMRGGTCQECKRCQHARQG